MQLNSQKIAKILDAEILGDASKIITGFNKLEVAKDSDICFFSNPKYESEFYKTQAGLVIVNKDLVLKSDHPKNLLLVADAYSAFAKLLTFYDNYQKSLKIGVENPAFIADNSSIGKNYYRGFGSYIGQNCQIGDDVKIYPQVFIGDDVVIGHGTLIFAGVKIYSGVRIGQNCIIHAGAVIGSDGFGFAPQADGSYFKIPQRGSVLIEDHVEIGANTCIDRATMGQTIIKRGVKLDNLVQIAHNVQVGQDSVMAAQSGIAGSGILGERCVVGGQVAIVGHLSIANGTKIGGQSGVTRSIKEENTDVNGTPAHSLKDNLRSLSIFRKLPELLKRIEEIERKL
jgi:UDP-3-O-[3-hydroxymyristoyl] glucosamine N-acyltransferase